MARIVLELEATQDRKFENWIVANTTSLIDKWRNAMIMAHSAAVYYLGSHKPMLIFPIEERHEFGMVLQDIYCLNAHGKFPSTFHGVMFANTQFIQRCLPKDKTPLEHFWGMSSMKTLDFFQEAQDQHGVLYLGIYTPPKEVSKSVQESDRTNDEPANNPNPDGDVAGGAGGQSEMFSVQGGGHGKPEADSDAGGDEEIC